MKSRNIENLRLRRVLEALADSVSVAPDQELLDDAIADGVDVTAEAARVRQMLLGTVLQVKKERRREAGRAHERHVKEMANQVSRVPQSPAERRALLDSILFTRPDMKPAVVTLQHRDFESFSDTDIESALRQLDMLGLLDADAPKSKP